MNAPPLNIRPFGNLSSPVGGLQTGRLLECPTSVLKIIQDQCDISGVLAQELRWEVRWLRSPRLSVAPEIPFAEELDLIVLIPEVRHFRILIGVFALGQD